MNQAEFKPSRHFWIWGFVFLFLLHAFAVFWLAERRDVTPARPKPAAFLFLSSDAITDQRLLESIAPRDPTLYSLPHAQGFSGGAWLRVRPQPSKLTNWSTPPEWLELPADPLGTSLNDYVATNQPSEEQLLGSLRVTKAPEVRIPDVPVITQTVVKVAGPLAARKLIRVPTLPPVAHADLLRRTVLTVSVNSDGVVQTAAVVNSSGSKTADGNAIELARLFEFEPSQIREAATRESAPPVIGRLIFTWHVVPPTNGSPATASLP